MITVEELEKQKQKKYNYSQIATDLLFANIPSVLFIEIIKEYFKIKGLFITLFSFVIFYYLIRYIRQKKKIHTNAKTVVISIIVNVVFFFIAMIIAVSFSGNSNKETLKPKLNSEQSYFLSKIDSYDIFYNKCLEYLSENKIEIKEINNTSNRYAEIGLDPFTDQEFLCLQLEKLSNETSKEIMVDIYRNPKEENESTCTSLHDPDC